MIPRHRWTDPDQRQHCAECASDEGLRLVFGRLLCEEHARDTVFEAASLRYGEDCLDAMERHV